MSAFQSSMIYSLVLAVLGYIIISVAGPFNMAPEVIFAAGLLIGSFFIAIISNTSSNKSSTPAASDTNTARTDTAKTNTAKPANEQGNDSPTKTIYVGNLPYRANEAIIKELFEKFGYVHSVRLLKDRQTGKRRGFGFVEMSDPDAQTAITALNESEFQQRTLKVREAKDRPDKMSDGDYQEQM
jgi:RNA recognition motif-containing protein